MMSEKMRESLSALMDNETDELETRRLLAEMDKGTANGVDLRASWSRYQVASFAMKNELSDKFQAIDLSSRISEALGDEALDSNFSKPMPESVIKTETEQAFVETNTAINNTANKVWLKPLGGLAIAASAAFVTVFAVMQFEAQNARINTNIEVASAAPAAAKLPATASTNVADVASRLEQGTLSFGGQSLGSKLAAKPGLRSVTGAASNTLALPVSYGNTRVSLANGLERAHRQRHLAEQRLDNYLIFHAEHAALNNSQGMLPMARVANFEYK